MHCSSLSLILAGAFLLSCCSPSKVEVELSPFAEDIIASYCENYSKAFLFKNPDEIYLQLSEDSEYYYLSIWGDEVHNANQYPFTLRKYVGKAFVADKPVYVSGSLNSIFYKAQRHRPTPIKGDICEYDPLEWTVTIRKCDTTYCLMKSRSSYPAISVQVVDSVALKYFKPSIMTGDEIYSNQDLDVVAYPFISYEERQELIESKYRFKEQLPLNKVIIIDLVVDKNGNASFYKVTKKSGRKHFDEEALRMAKDICKYQFHPAIIRGQNVNTFYSLTFYDKGLMFL